MSNVCAKDPRPNDEYPSTRLLAPCPLALTQPTFPRARGLAVYAYSLARAPEDRIAVSPSYYDNV